MDNLDRKIIGLLQIDGRASNAEIARQIKVSEGTVRRRARRLLNERIIRVLAIPDHEKLGYGTVALIGLQVDPDKIDAVSDILATIREVQYVAITTGVYDIFLWVALGSTEALGAFIRDKVGTVPGVRRTETFVNLATKKRTFGLPM